MESGERYRKAKYRKGYKQKKRKRIFYRKKECQVEKSDSPSTVDNPTPNVEVETADIGYEESLAKSRTSPKRDSSQKEMEATFQRPSFPQPVCSHWEDDTALHRTAMKDPHDDSLSISNADASELCLRSPSPRPGCSHWEDTVFKPENHDEEEVSLSDGSDENGSLPQAEDHLDNATSVSHLPQARRKEDAYIPDGRRIFDIRYLFQQIEKSSRHYPFGCSISDMKVVGESRKGFLSLFQLKCQVCAKEIEFYNEDPKNIKLDINNAMVTSMACTGKGYAQLAEMSAILNMPCMTNRTYQKKHNAIASKIRDVAWEHMALAGKEEAELALMAGDTDKDGIPVITVVADGSWAKRSYKNNYNSLSGVACIVGFQTKKVLFIGVRNKYCSICAQERSRKREAGGHHCFKNWNASSTAMESDIIVEGFKSSVKMHNLKYHRLIGDGDSSIIQRLAREMPYGLDLPVQKIECKNHLLRNYCNRLRDIVRRPKNSKGHSPILLRKIIGDNIMRLRAAVTSAIAFRSETSSEDSVKDLENDIQYSPRHVFGDHTRCAGYFCKGPKEGERNIVPDLVSSGLWEDIIYANSLLYRHSPSLIMNVTNNDAEAYNSYVTKYVGGKRVNFSLRGAYQTRCEIAATAHNVKQNLHSVIHKGLTNSSPGFFTKKFAASMRNVSDSKRKRRLDYTPSSKSRKRRREGPDEHYGMNTSDAQDDPGNVSQESQDAFLASLSLTKSARDKLELETRDQRLNKTWFAERWKRLTASSFGRVCCLRKTTSREKVADEILFPSFRGNKATNYGNASENLAIADYEKASGNKVLPAGLFVHDHNPFLAASPDGVISDGDGIIEIKCPFNCREMTLEEGISKKKISFLEKKEGKYRLRRGNNYHFQVQGQLEICEKKYCEFIVWTPHGFIIDRIERDPEFWEKKMKVPLTEFYHAFLLPKISRQLPSANK